MTLILSETRERLLKAIVAQVPPDRIAEIHFFAPIKQGGVESGVAVVAAVPESVAATVETAATDESAEEHSSAEESAAPLSEEPAEDPAEEAAEEVVAEGSAVEEETASEEGAVEAEPAAEERADEAEHSVADETVDAASGDVDVGTPDVPAPDTSSKRHVIYTARYRYTLKGPDRGKWETNVKAEADAPLITVETVVRGVQRRVGDVDEPERVSGDEIRTVTNVWAAAGLPGTKPAAR